MLYKVYTRNNVYKSIIEGGLIGSDFNYTVQTNGGQGVLTISLKRDYSDTSIVYGDIIKAYDDNGSLKYTGFVNTIYRKYTPAYNYIEYQCVGISSLLSQVIYKDGSDYQKVVTSEPFTIINSLLSQVNSKHAVIESTGSIQILGTTIEIEIQGNTCREILDQIATITGWSWHIGADGILIFGDSTYYNTHTLTLGGNIESMEIEDDGNDLYNTAVVRTIEITYDINGNEIRTPIYTEYVNNTSITANGRRERLIKQDNITNVGTGGILAGNLLEENKNITQKISLQCNMYDATVNAIKPGDKISIRNSDYILQGLLVTKISYSSKSINIDIKNLDNYTKLLQKKELGL